MSVVLWEKRGHVRIMTLNRPDALNALTPEVEELHAAYLQEFIHDDDAWVLIFTGAGRAFCAGLDLKAPPPALNSARPATLIAPHAPEVWKPTIAAVGGYALGGGCELALACDIRIAADDARFGLPEVKRALVPGAGGCQRLPRAIGLGDALLLLFTGDWIDAAEAYRIGLAQRVVPRDKLLDEALALAERICANAPLAVRAVKETVYRGLEMPLRSGLAQDRLFVALNRQSEDAREGVEAFKEKRQPQYQGR